MLKGTPYQFVSVDRVLATIAMITDLLSRAIGSIPRPGAYFVILPGLLARLVCVGQMSTPNLASPLFGAGKIYFLEIEAVSAAAWTWIQARRACMARTVAYEFATGIAPEWRVTKDFFWSFSTLKNGVLYAEKHVVSIAMTVPISTSAAVNRTPPETSSAIVTASAESMRSTKVIFAGKVKKRS